MNVNQHNINKQQQEGKSPLQEFFQGLANPKNSVIDPELGEPSASAIVSSYRWSNSPTQSEVSEMLASSQEEILPPIQLMDTDDGITLSTEGGNESQKVTTADIQKPSNDVDVSASSSSSKVNETESDVLSFKLPKMPGNMKRKFFHFMKQGLSRQEAYEKAKIKLPERIIKQKPISMPTPGKRNRSANSISPGEGKKKTKTNSSNSFAAKKYPARTYSDVVKGVKIGIVPQLYPDHKLNVVDRTRFQKDVERSIVAHKASATKPKFVQLPTLYNGFVIFHCADVSTANWLKSLPLWEENSHIALEEHQFPTVNVVVGYFQSSTDRSSDDILGLIQGQNEDLNTDLWKVTHRSEIKSCAVVHFEIDAASLERLRNLGFKVDFGYGQKVKLTPKGVKSMSGVQADVQAPRMVGGSVVETGQNPGPSNVVSSEASGSNQSTPRAKQQNKAPKPPMKHQKGRDVEKSQASHKKRH